MSGRWRPTAPGWRHTFIDDSGQVVRADAFFDNAGMFREGLVPVRVEQLWGYADWSLVVKGVQAFSEGLAAVSTAQGFSYINGTGAVIIARTFRERRQVSRRFGRRLQHPTHILHAGLFFHGRANVHFLDRSYGYIDRAGRTVYRWKDRRDSGIE
jgi:hypothetical protein